MTAFYSSLKLALNLKQSICGFFEYNSKHTDDAVRSSSPVKVTKGTKSLLMGSKGGVKLQGYLQVSAN